MLKRDMNIADYDPELYAAIQEETLRQEEHIELIASENYTSPRVMQAQGSQHTNKRKRTLKRLFERREPNHFFKK